MGIDDETDEETTLQIGPTTLGMVRLYVERGAQGWPMDFTPDEAEAIAEELTAAAAAAREATAKPDKGPRRR